MGEARWSDWYAHDGLRIPVPGGTLCQVETQGGHLITDTSHDPLDLCHASLWLWSSIPEPFGFLAIVRYRFRRLQALEELQALVADPYMVPPSRELVNA